MSGIKIFYLFLLLKDYAMERTQAFKLMGKVLVIAPQIFPTSFARSLVAVANFNKEDVSKEDPFRKVSLKTKLLKGYPDLDCLFF